MFVKCVTCYLRRYSLFCSLKRTLTRKREQNIFQAPLKPINLLDFEIMIVLGSVKLVMKVSNLCLELLGHVRAEFLFLNKKKKNDVKKCPRTIIFFSFVHNFEKSHLEKIQAFEQCWMFRSFLCIVSVVNTINFDKFGCSNLILVYLLLLLM